MLYFFGVGIKNNTNLSRGLTNIYGIGLNESKKILNFLGLSPNIKVSNLEKNEIKKIEFYFKNNSNLIILKRLKKLKKKYIWNLINNKSYKGMRHKNGLPVNGQRTHNNNKTQKKLSKSRLN